MTSATDYIHALLKVCQLGVDQSLVEDAIGKIYNSIGFAPPRTIVWLNGPLEVQLLPRLAWLMPHEKKRTEDEWASTTRHMFRPRKQTMRQKLSTLISGTARSAVDVEPIVARISEVAELGCVGQPLMAQLNSYLFRQLNPKLSIQAEERGYQTGSAPVFQSALGRYFSRVRLAYQALAQGHSRYQLDPIPVPNDCPCVRDKTAYPLDCAIACQEIYFLAEFDWQRVNSPHRHKRSALDEELANWITLITGAFSYQLFENVCFVIKHPEKVLVDESSNPHCETGPALEFANGEKGYCWHGISVPEQLITERQFLSPFWINCTENVELRRAMIEVYGWERYLKDTRAKVRHEDEYGKLYRKEIPFMEAIQAVEVLDSTPAPDGTRRKYLLRVPPDIETAKAAVAWTFAMRPSQYDLTAET